MTAAKPKPLLVAKDGFICQVKGVEHLVRQGETVPPDHPAAKAHPELFTTHEPEQTAP
jgi:hypothetical protein